MSYLTIPQIKRLSELAEAGLSDAGVAIVLNLDYGLDVNKRVVNYYRRKYTDVHREVREHCPGVANDLSANFAGVR